MSALHRREVVKSLLSNRGDTMVVTGLGQSTYDAFAAGDDPRTFYLWGAMGGAVPIGRYGETGQQVTHTARGTDLAGVAKSVGFREVFVAEDEKTVGEAVRIAREGEGPVFVLIKVSADAVPMVLPPKDGAFLKTRFRQAVVGEDAVG